MKVKKYISDSMPEAMNEVRKDLGSDAVILQSKEIKQKGFLGLFQKKKIEVIAAKDPDLIKDAKNEPTYRKTDTVPINPVVKEEVDSNLAILQEIRSLKEVIKLETAENELNIPVDYKLAYHQLIDQEVNPKLADEIIQHTVRLLASKKEEVTQHEIKAEVKRVIAEKYRDKESEGINGKHKIVQFVGPTGVGKTTTIAKVAAKLMLKKQKKVAFITTDTYRIAAIEQLKTYARILNIPVEVAYNVDDYKQAIQKLSNYDVILVDTAGRNFRNPVYIKQLKELMGNVDHIATYLVLSLTAKPKDLQDIFIQFEEIPLKEIIFTKLDETSQYGSILNISLMNNIGIAYMTNGQDVPDDLVQPTAASISEWIMENGK